ncbi:MAG: hypothetical protein WAN52_17130, partial [Pseudolabrys sp.]
ADHCQQQKEPQVSAALHFCGCPISPVSGRTASYILRSKNVFVGSLRNTGTGSIISPTNCEEPASHREN